MKLTTIYKLIQLGFVPIKTHITPRVNYPIEALSFSFLSEDGNKALYLLVSDTKGTDGTHEDFNLINESNEEQSDNNICFVRLDKTCGKSDTEKYYHKVIETYVEENQVIGYVEDKLNITETNQILGGNS